MTTLTERYVWGVLRAVPESQRADLEPEIQALVADAVEARVAAGIGGPADAERAALIELGDPERLAARYSGRSMALIGPVLFPAWRRVLLPVLAVVVPIVAIVSGAATVLADGTVGEVIVSALSAGWMTGVMIAFWITLVFAVMERTGAAATVTGEPWTPDALPDVPSTERLGALELVGALTTSVIVAGIIIWQQVRPPIEVDGQAQPLFDPSLWSFWLPYFLVLTAAEVVFTVIVYRIGRWTYPLAAVNAIFNAAFAIPALWLLVTGQLFNPVVVESLTAETGEWLAPTTVIIGVSVAVIVVWDSVEAFWKAYQNTLPERRRAA